MINQFYTTQFTVKRQAWNGERSGLVQVATFMGHLQQASSELAQNYGMAVSKTFVVWCSLDSNVKVGDKLEETVNSYFVKESSIRAVGNNQHLELILERVEKTN